jgi:starvation-inducible DNA-binding protein
MTGQYFWDYHLLLDEHSEQNFAMTDDNAERAQNRGNHDALSLVVHNRGRPAHCHS